MKKWMDTKGLKFKLWLYFGLFAAVIMIILWLFQIIFLGTFYETMKKSEIDKIGQKIASQYQAADFEEELFNISFQNGVMIQLFDASGKLMMNESAVGGPRQMPFRPMDLQRHMDKIQQSESGRVIYTLNEGASRNHMIVFGAAVTDESGESVYLYLSAPLAPVDATTQVLQNQLLMVTAISLLLGVLLAYFIAKRLARPISKITASANDLARGDLNVRFERGDYTEINALSDALNHMTRELSKTDQLRRDLMANVSHDLKTPLTIIKSYAEMIRDLSGANPEKRAQHTQVIIDETDRLTFLVNDILDLSKIEAGVSVLRCQAFDLSKTVREIAGRFHVLEENEGYRLSVRCDENLMVCADQPKIEQVIYNLIGNAVNYTGDDRLVTIELKEIKEAVQFSVSDTGPGILPEELDKVFERYYRSGKNHKRKVFGSGMGLSIVKGILAAHSAPYGVSSQPGAGTTFWFSLQKASLEMDNHA